MTARARTPGRRRTATYRTNLRTSLRDQVLIALTDKTFLQSVIETTHSASSWAVSAMNSSKSELANGIEMIDAERDRLEERLRAARVRSRSMHDAVKGSAAEAEAERVLCRLQELADQRTHLKLLTERIRPELEVESIEWQRPLVVGETEVVGYVDLWATVRVTSYRVQQVADPWDAESRPHYEGCSAHHLVRTIAVHVEPAIRSLSGLIRRVRFVQAHAKTALPLVVTCAPVGVDVLTGQGIPTYIWSPERDRAATKPGAVLPERRPRRAVVSRAIEVAQPPRASLPSPRPSLPPAPLT